MLESSSATYISPVISLILYYLMDICADKIENNKTKWIKINKVLRTISRCNVSHYPQKYIFVVDSIRLAARQLHTDTLEATRS